MRRYHKTLIVLALMMAGPVAAQNNSDYQPGTTGQRKQSRATQYEQTRGAQKLRDQETQRRTIQADGQEWRESSQQARSQPNQRILRTTAGEIAENPERFYEKTVRVRAEVEDVKGRTVFTLDEDKWFAGPDVLVVAPGGISAPREGSIAEVTGTVREFVSRNVYTDYDWYGYGWHGYNWDYYSDVWVDWKRRPVVMADSIVSENGRELVMQKTIQRPGGSRQLVYTAEPGDILANAPQYYGSTVSVRADVADAFGPHAFTLDEDRLFQASDLMVIVPRPAGRVPEDQNVTVIGTVRPFVRSQFESDYGWFDMNLFGDADVGEWEQERRPVIIAKSVRTQSGNEHVQAPGRQQQMRNRAIGGTHEEFEGDTGRSQDSGYKSDR